MQKLKKEGFSLIELIVVLAIIAILAGIAIPNYKDYVIRTRVIDVLHTLESYRGRIEAFAAVNGTMPLVASDVGFTSPTNPYINSYFYNTSNSGIQSVILAARLTSSYFTWSDMPSLPEVDLYGVLNTTTNKITWTCVRHFTATKQLPSQIAPQNCQTILPTSF